MAGSLRPTHGVRLSVSVVERIGDKTIEWSLPVVAMDEDGELYVVPMSGSRVVAVSSLNDHFEAVDVFAGAEVATWPAAPGWRIEYPSGEADDIIGWQMKDDELSAVLACPDSTYPLRSMSKATQVVGPSGVAWQPEQD